MTPCRLVPDGVTYILCLIACWFVWIVKALQWCWSLLCTWRCGTLSVSSISRSRQWAIKIPEQFLSVAAFVRYRLLLLFALILAEYYACRHVRLMWHRASSRDETITGLPLVVFGCWKEEEATKLCTVIQRLFFLPKRKKIFLEKKYDLLSRCGQGFSHHFKANELKQS